MRSKKSLINITTSILYQIIAILFGFIVPKLIIKNYGSSVNGLIESITQFLGYIVLLESGIGGVIKAVLYKPLAEKNEEELSKIIKSTSNFFKKIAYIYFAYIIVLSIIYPLIINKGFSNTYTALLIIIISTSSLFQYYFGLTYQLLLQSDQKAYIPNLVQAFTLILNTIIVYIATKLGLQIHIIELLIAIVYLIRPIFYNIYVNKKYNINKNVKPDKKIIAQRWDGFGQHIAYFIHSNTDIMILTIFLKDMKEISVYSVYLLIIKGIRMLFISISTGISPTFGNIIAKKEKNNLDKKFNFYLYTITNILFTVFTAAAVLIVPFVKIYTKGITDVNYIRPVFAIVLLIAEAIYCLRDPFGIIIFANGHYKETKKSAYIEALTNIILSIILVKKYQILGVAIGTAIAMLYRAIYYIWYMNKNLLKINIKKLIKNYTINILASLLAIFTIYILNIKVGTSSYFNWIISAFIITIIITIYNLLFNYIFCNKEIKDSMKYIKNILISFVNRRTK